MRRPVCALFAGALSAQLIAAYEPQVTLGPLAAFFVGICLAVMLLGGRHRGYGPWLLAGAMLGIGFTLRTQARLEALTSRYDNTTVRLVASVEEVREGYTRLNVRAKLRVESARGQEASFCCWCDNLPACEAGDRIEGIFTLESPGQEDRPGRYADEIVFLADYSQQFARLGEAEGFRAWSDRLQQTLSDALCRDMEGDEAGALAAMVVGDRSRISTELNSAYRAAGLSHVLVVSGMHVTILCGMGLPALWDLKRWLTAGQKLALLLPDKLGFKLYRRFGVRLAQMQLRPARPMEGCFSRRRVWALRLRALGPVALAVLLTGITGFTPSVLRAAAAVAIGAFGVWVMAPADAMTSLALAGLVMSAFNSYAVCDVGFELSYAAVMGTLAGAALARRRTQRLNDRPAFRREGMGQAPLIQRAALRLARAVWTTGCVSLCASATTFPVLVLRGMSTSPYALISGVAVLWMVQPMMILGILAALTGLVPALYPVYHLLAMGAGALARLLNAWVEMVSQWPGAQMAFDSRYAAAVSLILMGLCYLAYQGRVRARFWVPALVLAAAVGIGGAVVLSRDVVQVALVGSTQTPSVILTQNGQTVVLYRGGSSGRTAVEGWLESHGLSQPCLLVDLRSEPSRVTRPQADRVILASGLGDYATYRGQRGDMKVEVLCLPQGRAALVTVGRWRLAAVNGTFELAQTMEVDWLLASPSDPSAFRWEGVLALKEYDWMDPDTPRASGLLLRPGGGVRVRR